MVNCILLLCVICCTSPLLYFCTVLHNCSNARVRYKISCWYSFICKQGLQLIFKPNSINCFVLARNTASMLQIRNATYQNVPKSLNYILSNTLFLHHQCLNCNFFTYVSSDHVSPHAPAIERSQSDRNSNFFVCLPCFALHRMYTGIPRSIC